MMHPRIGKVKSLFEEGREKLCHVQWFEHGAQTVLRETASPQELFLLNECASNPLSAILRKVSVLRCRTGHLQCRKGLILHSSTTRRSLPSECFPKNSFLNFIFFRYLWDEQQVAFIDPDADMDHISSVLQNADHSEQCEACASTLLQDELLHPAKWSKISG